MVDAAARRYPSWIEPRLEALEGTRARTLALIDPLDHDVLMTRAAPFLSPPLWDLGHLALFEEEWLVVRLTGRTPRRPDRRALYDAFETPRSARDPRLLMPRDEALAMLADVRADALLALARIDASDEAPLFRDGFVAAMIVQHEWQHQETMLQSLAMMDVAIDAAVRDEGSARRRPLAPAAAAESIAIPAGPCTIGTTVHAGRYDNEHPRHRIDVPAFRIDRFPATNGRYLAFIEDGGYRDAALWSEEGWAHKEREGWRHPQGWIEERAGRYTCRRFGRTLPLDLDEPVAHVSFFEAEAFARWDGGRLPTEIEWEKAASWDDDAGLARSYPWGDEAPRGAHANLWGDAGGPQPIGSFPDGRSYYGCEHLLGDVYEWTCSPFRGYPGFQSFPYREYSEAFFGATYRVLRGSSWCAGPWLSRATYRNWDLPQRRQIFAGVRVAREVR